MVDINHSRVSAQEVYGWGMESEDEVVYNFLCDSSSSGGSGYDTDGDSIPAGPSRDPGHVFTVLVDGLVPGPTPWHRASFRFLLCLACATAICA